MWHKPYQSGMNLPAPFDALSAFDAAAILFILVLWQGIGWRIEWAGGAPSVSRLMADYRRLWMQQMITRQPRVFDAQIVGTLRQGTAFFASTSIIGLGALLALIGNADALATVAEDLSLAEQPRMVWEIKLMLAVFFLADAFLKFAWANRLFGYCSVLMAAVPNEVDNPAAPRMAARSAEVNITAARSFNRGLRSLYFALASLAWLAGALALMGAALLTAVVIWRREFASQSRRILLEK